MKTMSQGHRLEIMDRLLSMMNEFNFQLIEVRDAKIER